MHNQETQRPWLATTQYRCLALAAFLVLAGGAHFYFYFAWDLGIARFWQASLGPLGRGLMRLVSLPGNGWVPYILTAVTAIILWLSGWRRAAGGLALSAGGSSLLNGWLKWLVGRPRPSLSEVDIIGNFSFYSFPSGHVTFYVCYFGFIWLLLRERLVRGWRRTLVLGLLWLPMLLISWSRIALGAHWPSDTLGAYLGGTLWLGLVWQLYQQRKPNMANYE